MSAEIFLLASQEHLYRDLSLLVKRHVFDGENVVIRQRLIADDFGARSSIGSDLNVALYFRLLRASMIATAEFTVLVEDTEGNWSYLGYEESRSSFMQLGRTSLPSLLPAVSVMNRMMMLPREIYGVLKADSFSWILRPLEIGGVKLVDFQNADALRESASQVGARLRTEVVALSRRHMLMRGSSEPGFEEISQLLDLDRDYLERHRSQIMESIVRLTPRVVSGPAKRGRTSRVALEIYNQTGGVLQRVRLQVRGPSDAMKAPVVTLLDFPADETVPQRVEFEISPRAAPYCPLQVRFEISETSEWYAPSSVPVVLDVV